ncbi:MAG: TraI/MobA(P) family conjugative relaxase [Gammaproteobacteria bacterium]
MIAKKVMRTKGTSSVSRLVRYMIAAEGGIEPESWKRTVDQTLVIGYKTLQNERVASVRITNCDTDDAGDATRLMLATQSKNTRSRTDKTYHLVYSFPPDEKPDIEILHAIEDELCAAIGYTDHQRLSAVHVDTDHLHVHVVINKVHPTGFQNIEPYYDVLRLMKACDRLEIKYNLQRTNHGLEDKHYEYTREHGERLQLDREQHPEQRESSFRRYLRESYNLTFSDEPEASTLNNMRTLSSCHLARVTERSEMLLQSNARHSLQQRGEERIDGLRRTRHGDRATPGQSGKSRHALSGKAADVEAHSGFETLAGYATRELAPLMRTVTSWQKLHDAAAEHGFEVRLRGAGLVIGDPKLNIWVKASQVGRDLSFKALTDRLGTFQASERNVMAKTKQYEPRPRSPEKANFFNQYQRERQASILARRHGFEEIKRERTLQNAQIKQWSHTQRMLLKAAGGGAKIAKRILYTTIKQQADAARQNNRQNINKRRQELFNKTKFPTWADWLSQQAELGNIDALSGMRSREERAHRLHENLLTVENTEQAKTVIFKALKPIARKDGVMVYSTIDGGKVLDRATHVHAQKATTGAAMVAIELASKRFEGQSLIVEGTDNFRQEVAKLAGMHNLKVKFSDPTIEQYRVEAAASESNQLNSAIEQWIADRNKKDGQASDIDLHRHWQSSDAGIASYQGSRRMNDGSKVLLLQSGNEILVKAVNAGDLSKIVKWKLGRLVQLDARGNFIFRSNELEL